MLHRFRFVSAYVFAAVFIYVISTGYCRKRIYYFNVERPIVTYLNPDYVANVTFTARRISRSDPAHYMNLSFILKKEVTNEMMHSYYFYQRLTNAVYIRSFVEFHFNTCDLMQTSNIFGASTIAGYYQVPAAERQYPLFECPVKPGYYRFEKVKVLISNIPENFPFDEGRCHYNVTLGNKHICNAFIDFQLLTEQ